MCFVPIYLLWNKVHVYLNTLTQTHATFVSETFYKTNSNGLNRGFYKTKLNNTYFF